MAHKNNEDDEFDVSQLMRKIIHKIKTGTVSADSKGYRYDIDKLDFSAPNIKFDYMRDGKLLVVHDVPIAKEIVQFYESDNSFHYKPAHAVKDINVEFSPISISHPNVHFFEMDDAQKEELTIGYLHNGHFKDGKKYADLYFFVDKTPKFIIDNIENKRSNDVSIGFIPEVLDQPGEFQGQKYDKIQKIIELDHLGILKPGEVGRASFPEGVGMGADKKIFEVKKLDDKLLEISEKLKDAERALKDSEKEVADSKNSIDSLTKDVKELKDKLECDDMKNIKDKAKKFDEAEKEEEKEEEKKVEDLKKKILDIKSDDKTKKFIEGMDSERLDYLLTGLGGINGLPKKKEDTKDKGKVEDDEAMAYLLKKNAKANKIEEVI